MNLDYSKTETPVGYVCGTCGAKGVKLWREYSTFNVALECGACSLKSQGKSGPIDADGRRDCEFGGKTDQIGWRVPAVPIADGAGYWGYCSVPDDGVAWWRRLPTGGAQ